MSADNWTICPKCKKDTLREDYEVGIRNGVFEVNYGASCVYEGHKPGCGFKYSYRRSERVPNGTPTG